MTLAKAHIGPIPLASPFCQAGLAGYSDHAMRTLARRHGCAYALTEALLDTILVNGGQGLRKSIDIDDSDHPVAGQIIGSEGETMAQAAILLANAGYDAIDLNFACPVKKIRNKARGGHMLSDVPRGVSVLRAVRDALPAEMPLTLSLRRAFDESAESVERFEQIVDAAWSVGCCAIRVHGRSVEQKYQGRADWGVLRRLKQRYPEKTILGSGDVFTAHDAVRMLWETGVDIVWIARGAIGNPWIFEHAQALLADANAVLNPPSLAQQREALEAHFALAAQIHGEALAGRRMRKLGIKYSRFHPDWEQVKRDFVAVQSRRDWAQVLERWYGGGGAGVWPPAFAADEVNEDVACVS